MNKIFIFIFIFKSVYGYADNNVEKYSVKAGDYLYKIALKYYGDGNKWEVIYKANYDKIKNQDLIYEGTVIDIPLNTDKKTYKEEVSFKETEISSKVIDHQKIEVKDVKEVKKEEKKELNVDNKDEVFMKYKLKNKNSLSKDFPRSMASFNIAQPRIEVDKNFFDGEIKTKGIKKFFIKGEKVGIKLKIKPDKTRKLYIYSIFEENDDKITADIAGECEIVNSNEDKECIIIKNYMPVEDGMKIKLWN